MIKAVGGRQCGGSWPASAFAQPTCRDPSACIGPPQPPPSLLCTAAPRSSLHTNSLSSASVVQLKIYALPISPSFSQFLQSWLNPSVNLGKFTLKPLTADHSRVTAYVVVLCGVRQKIPIFYSAVTVKHCCSANTAALTIPSSGEAQIFLSSFFLFCFFLWLHFCAVFEPFLPSYILEGTTVICRLIWHTGLSGSTSALFLCQ